MQKCDKKCNKCSDFDNNYQIVYFDNKGLFPHTKYINGVKCNRYNKVAYSAIGLPISTKQG